MIYNMKTATIRLKNSEDVSLACAIFNTYIWDIDAVSGRYCVDAKSVLGLFLLLDQNIDIYLHSDIYDMHKELREELEDWLIKN